MKTGFNKQIVVGGYKDYLPRLYNNTIFENADQIPQGWKDYILNTPDISYHYANLMGGTLPGQRYEWYENTNFDDTTKDVLGELQ